MRWGFRLLSITVLCTVTLMAADFWEKKEYTKWSGEECMKLLEKSPWVRDFSMSRIQSVSPMGRGGNLPSTSRSRDVEFGSGSGEDFGTGSLGDREVVNVMRFRFVSALPVRMAIGRLRALNNPGQEGLEEQIEQYVNATPDQIVVEASFFSKPAGHDSLRDLERYMRSLTLPQLQQTTFLQAKNSDVHVWVSGYQPPGEGTPSAIFLFPRYDETGKPYFDGASKNIIFHMEINMSGFGSDRKHSVDVSTKTKDLKFQGQLEL